MRPVWNHTLKYIRFSECGIQHKVIYIYFFYLKMLFYVCLCGFLIVCGQMYLCVVAKYFQKTLTLFFVLVKSVCACVCVCVCAWGQVSLYGERAGSSSAWSQSPASQHTSGMTRTGANTTKHTFPHILVKTHSLYIITNVQAVKIHR